MVSIDLLVNALLKQPNLTKIDVRPARPIHDSFRTAKAEHLVPSFNLSTGFQFSSVLFPLKIISRS